jgi:predicted transcriptional regulator of viral defense system
MAIHLHPLKVNRHRSHDRRAVAELARRQWGRLHWSQFKECGVSEAKLTRWLEEGYLHLVYPRVYAVGHTAAGIEADLVAALFYAGPGAMLSHETAAWWWELTDREPRMIEVSTPRRCRSLPRCGSRRGVRVHARRRLDRVWHRRLPVTTVAQTLLDFASVNSLRRVRYALANADYRRLLDVEAMQSAAGRGRPGSDVLRRALDKHLPELAFTRSEFERRMLDLCESAGLPVPEVNAVVGGMRVDALWRDQRVIVELDGEGNHGTPAQIARDHGRDLRLRALGFTVLRYAWGQLKRRPDLVAADLRRALGLPDRPPAPDRPPVRDRSPHQARPRTVPRPPRA